jgi:hypothetical protein
MLYTGNYHTMARTVVLRVIIMLTSGDYKFAGWVAVCRQFEQTPSPMQDIARYNFRGGSGLPITNRILKQLAEGGDVDDVLDGLNTSLSTTTSYDEEWAKRFHATNKEGVGKNVPIALEKADDELIIVELFLYHTSILL